MPEELRQPLVALLAELAAVPRSARPRIVVQLLPILADQRIAVPTRIAAAARILHFLPDRERPVRRVARALTAGLSPSRGLDRLRELQHHVERCTALDSLIDRREKRVNLACPRCRVRLPRVEMVKHLWHEHGLTLDRSKTRALSREIEEFQEQHAATGDSESLDRVAELVGTAGLRRWLANDDPSAEELAPLLEAARERGAGLCPDCFAHLPAAVATLPEPLMLARGRLAGDGYAVEVGGNAWFYTLRQTTPERRTSRGRRSLAPRAVATLAAALVLAFTLFAARSMPFATGGIVLALLVYAVVRLLRSSPGTLADRAVDAAWARLGSKYGERPEATRFLTRLCLASGGRGDPESRARILSAIAQRAAAKVEESDAEVQLLAAARVLQVEDLSRYGRDVVGGIATLATDGFNGALPADYAEFVVGCYLTRDRDPGDLARLRVLLIGAAFNAGLAPRDLLDLWAAAPHLKRMMAVEPTHRLGLLFGLWQLRFVKTWEAIAPAESVFDLARTSPPTAARVLTLVPDLLLFHRPELMVAQLTGPILICARGVSIAGRLIADPDAEVRLSTDGRTLDFGRHQLEYKGRLPSAFPELLKKWLVYRAETLLPYIDGFLSHSPGDASRRVLGPYCRRCLACGTVSAVVCGAIGRAVPG